MTYVQFLDILHKLHFTYILDIQKCHRGKLSMLYNYGFATYIRYNIYDRYYNNILKSWNKKIDRVEILIKKNKICSNEIYKTFIGFYSFCEDNPDKTFYNERLKHINLLINKYQVKQELNPTLIPDLANIVIDYI